MALKDETKEQTTNLVINILNIVEELSVVDALGVLQVAILTEIGNIEDTEVRKTVLNMVVSFLMSRLAEIDELFEPPYKQ